MTSFLLHSINPRKRPSEDVDRFPTSMEPRPFDVETVFANAKRKSTRKLRGPDSPLYASIWPMVYVVRIFGFAPYNFSQDRLVPSNIYLIFSAIAAILYSYILYEVFQRMMGVKRQAAVLGGTEYAKVIINYSVVICELTLTMFTRHSFVKIWNALQDYDESVRQLGHPRKEMQTAVVAWILTIITAIIWIGVNQSGMYAFSEMWIYNVGYMLSYIGTLMALYKFVAMAFFLGQRFHHLNTIAIKSFPSTSTGKNTAKINRKVTILNLHNDLMVAAENLESLYSWSLLFWLGNLSLHIVSNLYFIIMWIFLESKVGLPIHCLSIWLLAFLFELLLLHIACNFASSQASRIGPILIEWQAKLMRKNHECCELSLQFLNRKLNFSAGGFFYVKLPLLRSIAAFLTTYLVILLQIPK
ncbi:ObirGr5 [Ooceraea biroi]|uniref:Gustatory receptor n=1 Tax=Ooceraea biroi TaxID=2015173 RepID=A0A3L8DLR0_OOCBI|nr:ObirGr5 [Ooceraea biroi]